VLEGDDAGLREGDLECLEDLLRRHAEPERDADVARDVRRVGPQHGQAEDEQELFVRAAEAAAA
jgi:hypothetical protein